MRKWIAKIENADIDFYFFVLTFFGITIIRGIIESFSSPGIFGRFLDWTAIFVHIPLWFAAVFVWIIIFIHLLTQETIVKIARVQLAVFPIIFFPIIADYLMTSGAGQPLSYLFPPDANKWLRQAVGFFANPSISAGIRMEIAAVLAMVIFYVSAKSKSALKGLTVGLIIYFLILFFGSLPGVIFILNKAAVADADIQPLTFYEKAMANDSPNVGRGYFSTQFSLEKMNAVFDLMMSSVVFIFLSAGLALLFYFWKKEAFFAFLKNLRPERLSHYWLMALMGIGISFITFGQLPPLTIFNIIALIVLFLTIAFWWAFAVGHNDIVDLRSDLISNPHRPLPAVKITLLETKSVNAVLFLLSLWGALILGYYALLFVVGAHIIAFLYSSPPLQIKKLPFFNPLSIAVASLLFMMAGFFAVSPSLALNNFPKEFIFATLACLTLGVNFKDIKDINGDRAVGVKTIPVIFGEKRGKVIIGAMMFLAFILMPLFLNKLPILPFAILFGAMTVWAINRKNYNETLVFGLYYGYIFLIVFAFIVL